MIKKHILSDNEVQETLNKIKYKDWHFYIEYVNEIRVIRANRSQLDSNLYLMGMPYSLLLKTNITSSHPKTLRKQKDVIRACWELITQGELHESAEFFCFDDNPIYHPHRSKEHPLVYARIS